MRNPTSDERDPLARPGRLTIAAAPEGHDARLIALTTVAAAGRDHLHVARDDRRMAQFAEVARFFVPGLEVIELPAWDCLPYDRVSPNPEISARRLTALTRLARPGAGGPRLVVTTVNAALQRVPAREPLAAAVFAFEPGQAIDRPALTRFLDRCGYVRAGTVLEPGEFAVRGGLIDIFPAGAEHPVRLDLFGDEIESIRTFDALSQRTLAKTAGIELIPVSEVALDEAAIGRFQARYRELFGIVTGEDPLFEAVSEGRRHAGMEHWLPLFHPKMDTIFDYLPRAAVTLDYLADDARRERLETIQDYYQTRKQALATAPRDAGAYKPIPPDLLYLDAAAWQAGLAGRAVGQMSPYDAPDGGPDQWHAGGRPGRDFAPERAGEGVNVYDVLARHVRAEIAAGRRVVMASYSAGARERLEGLLLDHGLETLALVENAGQAAALPAATVALAVLGLEHGFAAADLAVISEQDVLGDRLVRSRASARRAENFIAEASQLATGDLVVHVDHGVGRYRGLKTIDAAGAPHDCVALVYDGGDRLFLPVENIEMLSRFGSGDGDAALDRLGSGHWQQRKARLKQRLKDMAEDLIRIAADRALKTADPCQPPAGLMAEFCARFAYEETEDQARAIADVTADLASGRPMDRLVCGDVGFGKTEVALRTAFAVAMEGAQVALVCPTTLLARQHFKTFSERFQGLPVRIAELSRLTPAATARRIKDDLADGRLEIVIGTHALLAKGIRFAHLGLIIIDEEQHFGVRHKERLKQLRSAAHVLTLTATPIPRTLQLAMTGIRELSLIATPPVDRLAVRTFVLPFDAVVVREALLREHYRGGQSFYVCPRVSDLPEAEKFLAGEVPEVKFGVAHGQMAGRDLEAVMNGFYEGRFDVLLSTQIIESGLDIPTANTLVVHRADRFGLAQLYQLRGRIGRAKLRAYAYLTVPPQGRLTAAAEKRLKVLSAMDSLGAGFTLASHDLDIRGAGNLLGEEQSGHIREVGAELYQAMLEEAVATARGGEVAERWSPQIDIGMAVLIPDDYVADLGVRLELYRRIAKLEGEAEIEAFAAELIDRFGSLPDGVKNLLEVIAIKEYCRAANIEKVDAGPRGATVSFRGQRFANPAGLVDFITAQAGTAKLRPDHCLVYLRHWESAADRLKGVRHLVAKLAEAARQPVAA